MFKLYINDTSIGSLIFNDAPRPWQIGFQDIASPTMEGIIELHDQILFYLIVILVFISWIFSSIFYQYSYSKRGSLRYKYENHGTMCPYIINLN
jgi:cytochrome c oxidase subunit 2